MIKHVTAFWAVGAAVFTVMLLGAFDVLPEAFYWAAWIGLMCRLGPFIALGNKRLDVIRAAEEQPPGGAAGGTPPE